MTTPGAPSRPAGALRRGLALALVLAFLLVPAGRAAGDEGEDAPPEGVRDRVAAWLEDLRSPSFAVREAARVGLGREGGAARDLLEAAREDPDPEVRRTVRLLLDGLGAPPTPPAPPGDLGTVGRITLVAEGTLQEVLGRLGQAAGARFVLPPGRGGEAARLAVEQAPFFAALEGLLRDHGLADPVPFDGGGTLDLVEAGAEAVPGVPEATVGALRFRVAEVSGIRALGADGGRRHVVEVDLAWAPSVQVVTWQTPEVLEAVAPGGARYAAGAAMRTTTTWGVGSTSRQARLSIHLVPLEGDPPERLERLALRIPLRLRHARREVRFAPLTDLPRVLAMDEGEAVPGRPGAVVLRALGQPDGEGGPWVAEIEAWPPLEPERRSLEAVLEREDGGLVVAHAGARSVSADGRLELTARAYGRWEGPPAAVRVAWFEREEEGAVEVVLTGVPLR